VPPRQRGSHDERLAEQPSRLHQPRNHVALPPVDARMKRIGRSGTRAMPRLLAR
jgi:hypothetical protein